MFSTSGFKYYAFQNNYNIDYHVIRSYMRSMGEDPSVNKWLITTYDPSCTDYVFERGALVGEAPTRSQATT